jgi:WD40-like Beta Propeller Repeat
MLSTPPILRRALVVAGLCLAAVPAAASADSLVYIKGGNVWLSKADGTGAYQVTADGTADSPYRSPSQADDGTIAVSRYDEIVRMTQNGTVLNRIDPDPLENSVSHPVDGPPLDVAISPDGKRIAYTFTSYSCPPGASCGVRSATSYTAADHYTLPVFSGSSFFRDTSWVTNSRTLQFGGYGSQVNIHDVGAAVTKHWFDDSDTSDPSTDLGDGEATRQGTDFAVVRGYGSGTHLIWYPSPDVRTGTPAIPDPWTAGCATGQEEGIAGPTWSPDGTALALESVDGIWVKRQARDCTVQPTLVVPGGSQPDWGPANVNPAPRPGPGGGGGGQTPGGGGQATGGGQTGGTGSTGGVTSGPIPQATLKIAKVKLAKALRSGLKVTLRGAQPGSRAVVAKQGKKVVARGTAKVGANGAATVTLRFTKAGRKALRGARKVKLAISGGGAKATVTLKR